MVTINGYVAKGSEEYTERMNIAMARAEKKRNTKKKNYTYFYTTTSAIMTKGFQDVDDDSHVGVLECDIGVNDLDDFENSIVKLIKQKHDSTLQSSKLFKTATGYTFFSQIKGTNYIYVDRVKIERKEEH